MSHTDSRCTLAGTIFAVHGGIPRELCQEGSSLDIIRNLECPLRSVHANEMVYDMLWSDPSSPEQVTLHLLQAPCRILSPSVHTSASLSLCPMLYLTEGRGEQEVSLENLSRLFLAENVDMWGMIHMVALMRCVFGESAAHAHGAWRVFSLESMSPGVDAELNCHRAIIHTGHILRTFCRNFLELNSEAQHS